MKAWLTRTDNRITIRATAMLDIDPDPVEKRIRFGCGFVAGTVLAFLGCFSLAVTSGHVLAGVTIASGICFGICAVRYGDSFWVWLLKMLRWW